MAYVVDVEWAINEWAVSANSLEVPVPGGHKAGDLLIVIAQQDAGYGTFSISGGGSWNNLFPTAQAGLNGQRSYGWWRMLSSSSESAALVESTLTEELHAYSILVRGADAANPINASVIAATSGSSPVIFPTITTTQNNCLVLFAIGNDFTGVGFVQNAAGVRCLRRSDSSGTGALALACAYIDAPGVTTNDPGFKRFATNTNGAGMVVAIRDNGQDARTGYFDSGVDVISYNASTNGNNIEPIGTSESPGAITLALMGLPCATSGHSGSYSTFSSNFDTTGQPTNVWAGRTQILDSVKNLSDSCFYCEWSPEGITTSIGAQGYCVVFADTSGNWVAFLLSGKAGLTSSVYQSVLIDLERTTPDDSGGTIDWSNVLKIGFWYARTPSAAGVGRGQAAKMLTAVKKGAFRYIPGKVQGDVLDSYLISDALNRGLDARFALTQGDTQVLLRVPLQIGAAGVSQLSGMEGLAFSFPPPTANTIARKFVRVSPESLSLTLFANATDSVKFTGSVVAAAQQYTFDIHPESSPSAEYNLSGTVFFGMSFENSLTGVDIAGVTFTYCNTVFLLGGALTNCKIRSAVAAVAVLTINPGNISNCEFTQSTTGGHAIEITQPGTFAFVGNTFSGYGLDGTTDAAIYNNSGGHVTLNVSGGGDTPTIRNGSGATTDVVSGAQITVVGLATGSQVKVTKVLDGAVLFNGTESLGEVSFSTTYIGAVRVEARKASVSPFYKPWATQATTISGQTVEVTALQELDE